MTYSKVKTAFQIAPGEKLCLVIAVGYGTTQGAGHPVKQPEEVSKADSLCRTGSSGACGRHCWRPQP